MNLIVWQRAMDLFHAEKASKNFDKFHYELENRLWRLIENLEYNHDDGDWIARIMEDPEEYITPSLHHSITPPHGYA